jgi:hypothetical protein
MLCSWNYTGKAIENSWTGLMEKCVASWIFVWFNYLSRAIYTGRYKSLLTLEM